ncbi:MAG: Valine--tRNA ligase [Candidatus Methanoperedenaceae archaeon GB50]|nr:MAG: Valine--tRNA ligase [Candidatus Methanoperedenaceae archaeon GB50]CAD7778966.1 Valine--tRNA ligase [Candidatus Methanoperedenaceae archaeon GB50]
MAIKLLDKGYNPKKVEEKWYQYWLEKGLFKANLEEKEQTFSMVIPPPNVTGSLHMGHALNVTLHDILARYKKMLGYNVLWLPGTDHAGIATQNVVERELEKKGISRYDLGREEFGKAVWQWKEEYGNRIINQLKKLGCACDWSRQRFTLDEGFSQAVKEVFIRLYEEGLIYRGDYIINWCPRCQTALADLEVEHEEEEGSLYYIRYARVDGQEYVTVATTRPETLLGDTAVAVHPEDERYQNLKGVTVFVPILNREIPIIFDPYVDKEFGTGALKVTPAHDPNDFELGQKHNLPMVKVIDERGRMTKEAGPYMGLDRFKCRERILEDLEKNGQLLKIEPIKHSVGHCYRCKTIVEPLVSKQWFVHTKPLAEPAIAAVKEGKTRLIPASWEKTYYEWMNNIRDWCISRQIWWGHRIPVWYCKDCQEIIVAKEIPKACPKCDSTNLEPEMDVLDTWFSSALWPFGTLGWPKETEELKLFYPTNVLITGFDILFFWVARMMMMGLHFMGDVPFYDVYIHALVRDERGEKMSKTKGNVIDPLDMVAKYGTDALRFTLVSLAAQGRDIRLSERRIEGYRHFINKIWNAARFALMNLEEGTQPIVEPHKGSEADRWILSRLQIVIREVRKNIDIYEFDKAAYTLYHFVWHEFCDWYLEWIKPTLYKPPTPEEKKYTQSVLLYVLGETLKLLHPFIPFVTEEIWQHLPHTKESILKESYPEANDTLEDPAVVTEMETTIGLVRTVRNMRGELEIPPNTKVDIVFSTPRQDILAQIEKHQDPICRLAGIKKLTMSVHTEKPAYAAATVWEGIDVYMPLKDVLDLQTEEKRLTKEIDKMTNELTMVKRKLSNRDFLTKAPKAVVAKEQFKAKVLEEKLHKLTVNLERVRSLQQEK